MSETERDSYFLDFANRHMVEKVHDTRAGGAVSPREIAEDPDLRNLVEETFKSNIPAGYTYFGQFIDHDITFDPTPLQMRRNDPSGIHNFRTPRLDLDSVYGRGPDDQPYLYDQSDKGKMLIGVVMGSRVREGKVVPSRLRDLPRNAQGRALIGDMRNEENAIVSQIHLAFLLAHNTLVDRAKNKGLPDAFGAARRTLCWLYQYIAWNDFIKRVTGDETQRRALRLVEAGGKSAQWELGLKDVYNWKDQPFMPVEFSAAAYRFGHSMVRNEYRMNESIRTSNKFVPLFDGNPAESADDLRGFQPMRDNNVIQWDWFLNMTTSRAEDGFPQMARKIDSKLANALAFLPQASRPMNLLAYRNLKRGVALGLPAGTTMAQKYGLNPLKLQRGEPDALWFYILREAADDSNGESAGNKLGPLGSLIVCATFAGLLLGDPSSYFNIAPRWTPESDDLLIKGTRNADNVDGDPVNGESGKLTWTLASIIRIAGLPVDLTEFEAQDSPST
jgi:hypothetical protein